MPTPQTTPNKGNGSVINDQTISQAVHPNQRISGKDTFQQNLDRTDPPVQADILSYPLDLFRTREYPLGIKFDIYDTSGDAITEQRKIKKLFDTFTAKVSSTSRSLKDSLLAQAQEADIGAETTAFLESVGSAAGSLGSFTGTVVDSVEGLWQSEKKWDPKGRETQVEAIVGAKSPQNKVASIYLYLPGNLSFSSQFDYEEADMSSLDIIRGIQGAVAFGNPEAQADIMKKAGMAAVSQNSLVSTIGEDTAMNAMRIQSRQIQNPFLIHMFKGVQRRTFSFDFEMIPRSAEEARNVYAIVNTFRRYAHPSRNASGRFLEFPAEFELTFIYQPKGQEEAIAVPKVKKCAIHSVKVDYGDNIFSAHMGETLAVPTKIKMSIEMAELSILARQEIEDGY